MADYISEHSGSQIDSGVSKGEASVQGIQIAGTTQTKDANGIVNLPAYPTGFAWGAMTGTLSNQSDLNVALSHKQDKNVGSANAGKILYVNNNGDIDKKDDPQTAVWGNISGTLSNQTDLNNALNGKVSVVAGKGLSTNDYDNTEKGKVANIANIQALIPTEATTTNQLADKDYVNQQVASNSGTFKGLFNVFADLPLTGNNNNDTAHVKIYNETTHEEVGYSRYKWSTAVSETNKWIKEYDVVTNTFTPAQNAAIDSGVTSAKVTSYDAHIANTNNPHGVTKAQLGLDNVVNTGDSDTPVSGGTTKFTTGGAYTELNKKADKTNTIGSHTLADNVTSQHLLDDIKDLIGELTRKTIDGTKNTLLNIALSCLANLGTGNAGKPLVVGNDGSVVIGDNTPTYINISSQVSQNAYNMANGSFNHCKMVLQNDMVFYNIEYQLTNAVTDKQSAIRKVLELPVLGNQFSYPQKINVRLTQAVCQPTCQENATAYFSPSGEAYVNPTTFDSLQILYAPITLVNNGETFDNAGNPIFLAEQRALNGNIEFEGNRPILTHENEVSTSAMNMQYDWEVCPYREGTTTSESGFYHNTSNSKWYLDGVEITVTENTIPAPSGTYLGQYYYGAYNNVTTLRKCIQGYAFYVPRMIAQSAYGGYVSVGSYYTKDGTQVTGNFWQLRKTVKSISSDYMYKAHLMDIGCNVNNLGVCGEWSVEQDADSILIDFGNVSQTYRINHGCFGTATFTAKPQTSANDLFTLGDVINNTLYVNGAYAFDKIQIGAGGIM